MKCHLFDDVADGRGPEDVLLEVVVVAVLPRDVHAAGLGDDVLAGALHDLVALLDGADLLVGQVDCGRKKNASC